MGLREKLFQLGACAESLAWVGNRDLDTAWSECPNGSWLVWVTECAATMLSDTDIDASDAHWDARTASAAYWSSAHRSNRATANAVRDRFPTPPRGVRQLLGNMTDTTTDTTTDTRED